MISLSASKVDCFLGCQRLFKMRYITKPFVPPENKYFVIGNISHKALELFYSRNFHQQPENFKLNLSACLKEAYKKYNVVEKLKKNEIVKKDIENIRTMMRGYLNVVLPTPAPKVAYIEKSFHIDVDDFMIAGKADRIDTVNDDFVIIDYKTNSRAFTKKELEESVQLPTYKLWLDRLYKESKPAYKVFGEYVYLKLTTGKKWKSTFEITEDKVEAALEKYRGVKRQLNNNCSFKRNMNYKYCGPMCDYFSICRKEGD